jgi:hypothetical protein
MLYEVWSWARTVFEELWEPVVVVAGLGVLSRAEVARDIESEGPLNDGASSRQIHQEESRWNRLARWLT